MFGMHWPDCINPFREQVHYMPISCSHTLAFICLYWADKLVTLLGPLRITIRLGPATKVMRVHHLLEVGHIGVRAWGGVDVLQHHTSSLFSLKSLGGGTCY
jgi:hypothetical protein